VTLPLISNPTEFDHNHIAGPTSTVATSAAKTWTSGRLYVAFAGCSGTTLRTVSSLAGASGTWTKTSVSDINYTDGVPWDLACFTCTNATGSASVTATLSGSASASAFLHIFEIVSGFDTSGLVVQAQENSVLPNATQLTIPAFTLQSSFHNLYMGYFVHRVTEAFTALNGTTKLAERQGGPVTCVKALVYARGQSAVLNPPGVSWATNTRGAIGTGIEIKAAKVAAIANRWAVAA
jgi:hypothetical protein